jgi:hypothetical protein
MLDKVQAACYGEKGYAEERVVPVANMGRGSITCFDAFQCCDAVLQSIHKWFADVLQDVFTSAVLM